MQLEMGNRGTYLYDCENSCKIKLHLFDMPPVQSEQINVGNVNYIDDKKVVPILNESFGFY